MINKYLDYFPIFSLIWFALTIVWAGALYPGYSHISQFISELGATGAPNSTIVNYLGFIVTGVFLIVYFYHTLRKFTKYTAVKIGLYLFLMYAISLIVAAIFPCDFEFPLENSSLSQDIHVISAGLAYLFAIAGILTISFGIKSINNYKFTFIAGIVCSVVSIICIINLDPSSEFVGVFQRCNELCIYLWIILFATETKRIHKFE